VAGTSRRPPEVRVDEAFHLKSRAAPTEITLLRAPCKLQATDIDSKLEEIFMNTIRMFAFIAAVLITAFVFRVIA
jgi:hypothetical protein